MKSKSPTTYLFRTLPFLFTSWVMLLRRCSQTKGTAMGEQHLNTTQRIQLNPLLPGTFCVTSDWRLWASVTSSIKWRYWMAWIPKSLPVSNICQILISSEISHGAQMQSFLTFWFKQSSSKPGAWAAVVQSRPREGARGSHSIRVFMEENPPEKPISLKSEIPRRNSFALLLRHFNYRLNLTQKKKSS